VKVISRINHICGSLPNNPGQGTFLFLEKVAQNALPASFRFYCCWLAPQACSSAMEFVWLS
jgi:hypothetical protein